jgi:hypothetical protein
MNLNKLKNLPVQERIAEFKKIRSKFLSDKNKLAEIIEKLEAAIKERESFAQNLSAPDRKALKNEVKALAVSIKNVKARLHAKAEELKLVEQALAEAEQNIIHDEKQLVEIQKQEKTKLELMITELQKREQTEQVRELEEEIKQAEIPEEVKQEVGKTADYMQKQNENFYKAQTSQAADSAMGSYEPGQKEGEREQEQTFYETSEQAGFKKNQQDDYKV